MSLKDIDVKIEYRSLLHNIASEFYIPALNQAISYDRAVGFFLHQFYQVLLMVLTDWREMAEK